MTAEAPTTVDENATAPGHTAVVTGAASVARFAAEVFDVHAAPTLLFNNAGVLSFGCSWETPLSTWERVIGINVMGVVHGLVSFVPPLISLGRPAHIVNTSSVAGLIRSPFIAPYVASKHAVVGLSEALSRAARRTGADRGIGALSGTGEYGNLPHGARQPRYGLECGR